MNDLLTINEDNIGGVYLLRFAPRHYFISTDPKALQFKTGLDWIQIEVIPETARIDHETATDDAGDHYNITVSASLPKERPEIDAELEKHLGLPCLIKLKDQNGYERLTGHTLGDLFLSHSSTSGEQASDANGYKINFRGKQLKKALFL